MLPDPIRASEEARLEFMPPVDRRGIGLMEDFQSGGIEIGSTVESHFFAIWKAWSDGSNIYCQREDESNAPYLITSDTNITEISFCFDQLMKPYAAYVTDGQSALHYFDTILGDFTTVYYPGVISPKLTLDDKSKYGIDKGVSDVMFFYINNREILYRLQRDRFEVEYVFANALPQKVGAVKRIQKLGMDRGFRLHVDIQIRQDS